MTTKTAYHVYAEDGFESAHRSLEAAKRAANRGTRSRKVSYVVVKTDVYGLTGGDRGTTVYQTEVVRGVR